VSNYALCYVPDGDNCLVIRKDKPQWQHGLLNVPGGHIEPGEFPTQAASRELFEETGLLAFMCEELGTIQGPDFVVHCCLCVVKETRVEQKTCEPVMWMPVKKLLDLPDIIHNLKLIVPLMHHRVRGWTIRPADMEANSNNWLVSY